MSGSPPGAAQARPESDTLTQHETVLLYGQSAGRCARCKTIVVRESDVSGKAFNIGKRAHMIGRSDAGPRGNPDVPIRERGDLRNHVLLCGNCHDEVDRDEESWPVEDLRKLREDHIAWVARLDEDHSVDHERLVYANAIDAACELVWLDAWPPWTQNMLHPPLSWGTQQMEAVGEFLRRINTTDWPGTHPELEVAMSRLAYLLGEASSTFADRAELRDAGDLHVFRDYKRHGINPNFHRDARAFTEWLEHYEGLIFEATKAAAWVRSAWRAAGNPEFMVGERVHLMTGPHEDLRQHINILEYTEDEKRDLIAAGRDQISSVPTLRLDFGEPGAGS